MAVLNKKVSGIPAGAVYIGRGSRWGNPFVLGKHGNRNEVVEKYRQHLWQQIQSGEVPIAVLAELRGRDLVCFCAPKRCHGHILEAAAEWAYQRLQEVS